MPSVPRLSVVLVLAALVAPTAGARAEEAFTATITIRDHRFEPSEIHVPAGNRIALTVINADPLSEEFDSSALKVEKVIAGKSQGVVHISPLDPRPLRLHRRVSRADGQGAGHRRTNAGGRSRRHRLVTRGGAAGVLHILKS